MAVPLSSWIEVSDERLVGNFHVIAEAAGADKELASRVDTLLDAWRSTRRHAVAVSNEVGSGVVPATVSGGRFRDELGTLNARIAAESEQVWLCVAGIAGRIR